MKPYYDRDGITIYCGDCREVLPTLPPADAIVTDPPYNVGFTYDTHEDRMPEEDYFAWLKERYTLAAERLNPGGALLWFWQGIRVAGGHVPRVLPEGFGVHHVGAWFKREFAGDKFFRGHPALTWEPIVWAVREAEKAIFAGRQGGHEGRDAVICNHPRHDGVIGHPCPKPEKAVAHVLGWVAPAGGLVIDPFCGSGTTLKVARDRGIRAIGIDVSEAYCAESVRRLKQGVLSLEVSP